MDHIKYFIFKLKLGLLRLKQFIVMNVVQFIKEIEYRGLIRRELAKCPDQYSREAKLHEIRKKEEESNMRTERQINLTNRMFLALMELIVAQSQYYGFPENPSISKEQYDEAPKKFIQAKEQAILNARWKVQLGELWLNSFIDELEPIEIDTFDNEDEWSAFMKRIASMCVPNQG